MFLNIVTLQLLISMGPEASDDVFRCPCVPLFPCLGVYCNLLLCTIGVKRLGWVIFGVFEAFGALFYVCYGYRNSRLPKRVLRHQLKKFQSSQRIELSALDIERREPSQKDEEDQEAY